MKLIESKAELLLQPDGLEGVYKQIEICGRTCYKSLDKMTEDSAKAFVDRMIASNHTAMLEQGTVYLYLPYTKMDIATKYQHNPYTKVVSIYRHTEGNSHNEHYFFDSYITTNFRVLADNNWLDDLKYLCEPTKHHEKRYTIKFITDRGVSHKRFVA